MVISLKISTNKEYVDPEHFFSLQTLPQPSLHPLPVQGDVLTYGVHLSVCLLAE